MLITMSCPDSFTCAQEIHILSYEIEGWGWFLVMLMIAFGLQWAANYVWIQNSQVTRELLQLDINKRGSLFTGKIAESMQWTLISTLVWIARIILVMGSNLWIFLVVLIGNLWGVYWTQMRQKPDHQYLADDILLMLKRLNSGNCDDKIKCKIKQAIKGLKEATDDLPLVQQSNEDGSSNLSQGLLEF